MGCSGCSNNGPTPIVGNLDDGAVVLAYTGDRTAAVTFVANGQDYQAGRDRLHDFVRVRPGDVPVLLGTGQFAVAPTWEPTLTIVLPTRGRVPQLTACLNSLLATAPGVRIVLVMDEDDAATLELAAKYQGRLPIHPLVVKPGYTAADKWNFGAEVVQTNTLVFAADDLIFHAGWAEATTKALRAFPDQSALVGFDELANSVHPLHFAVTRKLLDEVNGGMLVVPHYVSWYMDTELTDKARMWGRYLKNCGAVVEHRHPMHGTAPIDALHRSGFLAHQHRDRWIYEARKRDDFPTDFVHGKTPRNWLAGFVPPAEDQTEAVLNARMGITTPADVIATPADVIADALIAQHVEAVAKKVVKRAAKKAVPA